MAVKGGVVSGKMAAPMERLSGVCADLERWVRGQLEQGEPRGGVEVVQRLSELLREQVYREMTEERIFKLILQILSKASREIQTVGAGTVIPREKWLQLVAECFRCLRNSCVQCPQNQCVIRTVGLIDESVCLMKILSVSNLVQESCLVAFRCGLQFLGNTAAGNRDSQNRIWTCACPELFLSCLLHADEKVATYSSMVLFTCLESEKVVDLQDPDKLTVALNVIAAYMKQPDAEWLIEAGGLESCTLLISALVTPCFQRYLPLKYLIVTDRFLKCPELVKAMYAKLSNQERITMLELIMATISEKDPLSEEESSSLQKIAEILAGFFQEQCKAVLRLASADDDEEALVVIRLLDVLCEMTSNNEHLECLQNIPCLLDTVVEILRLTHLAGKQSKNVFTAVHTMTLGEDLTHVAVGFKAHLIRIIGNLCYKNKENQDKIFQLEGIPLILDNCSIDDNNPFLNQWAMFAIRNLTEHNKRNQELIAKMERQGLADSSLLNSMGFQVEDRDGKLLLKSTKK